MTSNGFLWSPEVQYNTSYLIKKANVQFSLFVKYNGKVNRYSYESPEKGAQLQQINAYTLADLIVSKQFKKGFLLSLGSKNALNVTNIASTLTTGAHSSSNGISIGTGRTYFIKVDYTWNKK